MLATAEQFLNATEAAARMGIRPNTFYALRRNGSGPAPTVLHRRKMYAVTDIDAWVESRRTAVDPVQEAVARLVAVAPPLSEEQKATLRAIFSNTAA